MASSFFGVNVARDSLQLAQKSIDLTLNNVANISTVGYSRQRLDICSVAVPSNVKGYDVKNLAGMGAEAIGVTQIRNKLLDTKVRKYTADLCNIGAKTSVLGELEDVLDDVENEESGFAAILGNFKSAFQSFSSNSADRKDLAGVAQKKGESVANVLKNFEMRIDEVMAGNARDLEDTNTKINQILCQMGKLNSQIKTGYVNMTDIIVTEDKESYKADIQYGPLELKDTFNRLADELSQYMNISVTEEKNGTFTVECRDVKLVYGEKYAKTDIKFNPREDEVFRYADRNDPDAEPLNAKFLEFPIEEAKYNRNGKEIEKVGGFIPQGEELYYENGTFTGLYANGKGGYYDGNGDKVDQIFDMDHVRYYYADEKGDILPDPKFPDGNVDWEVTDFDTVYQGMKVIAKPVDDKGKPLGDSFIVDVKGPFDGKCIENDYGEIYVSSINSQDGWLKAHREIYPEQTEVLSKGIQKKYLDERGEVIDDVTAEKLADDMIKDFNQLLTDCEVEEAYHMEKDIMELVRMGKATNPAKYVKDYYDPIFKENIREQAAANGIAMKDVKMPEYSISISEETGTVTAGSIKGLFDMYNGEGCYAAPEGNEYPGVKYFKETIRALSKGIVREFNSIYDEYNDEITVKKFAEEYKLEADFDSWTRDQQDEYLHRKKDLIDEYGFEMFEFDGADITGNLKVADSWIADPLRCVHPQGTDEGDYDYDELDNAYLNDILEVFERKVDFGAEDGLFSLEGFVTNYGNKLGSKLEYELGDFENASLMYKSVDDERESVMGVNMEEEGANMITYQKWYNAISRMMTALDQMLDKLINNTGIVGL